jgi:hypothetical protein
LKRRTDYQFCQLGLLYLRPIKAMRVRISASGRRFPPLSAGSAEYTDAIAIKARVVEPTIWLIGKPNRNRLIASFSVMRALH